MVEDERQLEFLLSMIDNCVSVAELDHVAKLHKDEFNKYLKNTRHAYNEKRKGLI